MTSALVAPATMLCGLATLMYFSIRLWATWGRGKSIDPMDYLKPFTIWLVIMFFPAMISGLESTLNIVTASTNVIIEKNQSDLKSLVKQKNDLRKQIEDRNDRLKSEYSAEDDLHAKESGTYDPNLSRKSTDSWLARTTQNVLIFLLEYALIILRSAMYTISILFRIILALIGPFVFALSLFPSLEGNIGSWFARYINVYLYIPIANILGLVQTKLFIIQNETAINAMKTGTYKWGMEDISYIIILGFSIIGWVKIPTIASWVIQSTGAGSYLGKVNEASAKGAQLAGKGAQKTPGAARSTTRAVGGALGKMFN